ncbi:MAG: nitroreductase family protein, partial [Leptospiraceae bacterium]|nr:nitroreductase family protein [Leptospiraceae bacterium]
PSSYGLQPFKVLVIEDKEIRKKIQPACLKQPQIVEASHLLVFCAWSQITEKEVDDFIHDTAKKRNIPFGSLAQMKGYIMHTITTNTPEQNLIWASKQCYIALGHALFAAALEQVDATPMEGFLPKKLDEVLGLEEKGLRSVVLCALGYRNVEHDYLVNQAKVRRDKEKFFEWI